MLSSKFNFMTQMTWAKTTKKAHHIQVIWIHFALHWDKQSDTKLDRQLIQDWIFKKTPLAFILSAATSVMFESK